MHPFQRRWVEGFVILSLSKSAFCWSERDVALFHHLKTVRKLFESCALCIFNPMASCWHWRKRRQGERKRERGERERHRQRQRETEADTERLSLLAEGISFSLHPVLERKNLCRVKGPGSSLALLCFMKSIYLKQIRFMLKEPKFLIQKHSAGLTSPSPSKVDHLLHRASPHCPISRCEFTCGSQSTGISQ